MKYFPMHTISIGLLLINGLSSYPASKNSFKNHTTNSITIIPADPQFTLAHILHFYNIMPNNSKFFARAEFLDKLAGTDELRNK